MTYSSAHIYKALQTTCFLPTCFLPYTFIHCLLLLVNPWNSGASNFCSSVHHQHILMKNLAHPLFQVGHTIHSDWFKNVNWLMWDDGATACQHWFMSYSVSELHVYRPREFSQGCWSLFGQQKPTLVQTLRNQSREHHHVDISHVKRLTWFLRCHLVRLVNHVDTNTIWAIAIWTI